MDPDPGAVVAGVGEGGQPSGGCGVERAEQVGAGCGQVVYRAGLDVGVSQTGNPSGRIRAWTSPPRSWVLPEYQASIVVPFRLRVLTRSRSVSTTFPSRIRCDHPSSWVRVNASCRSPGAGGEHATGLVEVAVGDGLGDPQVLAGQRHARDARGTTPARTAPASRSSVPWSRPGCRGRGAHRPTARQEPDQFPGDVEDGRISEHVEPFREEDDL